MYRAPETFPADKVTAAAAAKAADEEKPDAETAKKVDVFSFAMVMYFLSKNRDPWNDELQAERNVKLGLRPPLADHSKCKGSCVHPEEAPHINSGYVYQWDCIRKQDWAEHSRSAAQPAVQSTSRACAYDQQYANLMYSSCLPGPPPPLLCCHSRARQDCWKQTPAGRPAMGDISRRLRCEVFAALHEMKREMEELAREEEN